MAVFSPLVLIILSILLMTLYLHWILTRKLKRWSHLPGPSSPLVFLIMSAFSSDNSVLLRRFYTKYQKNGFCFVPLMNIPLLFLGDYRISKYFSSHPGAQARFGANGPIFNFLHDSRMLKSDTLSGVITSQGTIWSEQRNFLVKTLNTLGLKKSSLEQTVFEEVERFCHFLEEKHEKPVEIVGLFNIPVLSNLWKMTAGEDVDYNGPKLQAFSNDLEEFVHFLGTPAVIFSILCPWIVKTFPSLVKLKHQKQVYMNISNAMQELIEDHKKDLDEDNPRDLIDYFLIEMANSDDEMESMYVEDEEEKLRTLMIDIFIVGSATTANALSFGLLFLVRYPEVQRMVQEEIASVLGTNCPTLGHRKKMPYTQASIMEILRCANIIPILPRSTTEDVLIDGIIIPKDTIVLNIYSEIFQGNYWKEGETFNPGRFLDDSGCLVPDERLLAFGTGKRICPGQNLANMQMFLYITRILQLFTIHPETAGILPEETINPGAVTSPMPFKLRFGLRK